MIASETLFIIGDLRIIVNPCAANPSAVHPDTEPKRHAAAAGNTPGPVPHSGNSFFRPPLRASRTLRAYPGADSRTHPAS